MGAFRTRLGRLRRDKFSGDVNTRLKRFTGLRLVTSSSDTGVAAGDFSIWRVVLFSSTEAVISFSATADVVSLGILRFVCKNLVKS
jgi:hypothetical protein